MMKIHAILSAALLLPASCFAGLSSIWRHSAKIGRDGFLMDSFPVQGLSMNMAVRQVPGDGNCLFHAISACLDHACNSTHPSLDLNDLMPKSATLRKVAVDYLVDNMKDSLYLEKEESVPVYELLSVVAAQYNMTAENYCEVMRQSSVWGGGPEIVALSNALCRPIHVYELASNGVGFCFRRMACFGSPSFDAKQAIHILSADSRFPNLKPGKQLANGNHFLALFPCEETVGSLRGSAAEASTIGGGKQPGLFGRLWSSILTCSCFRRRTVDVEEALPAVGEGLRGSEGVGVEDGSRDESLWQGGEVSGLEEVSRSRGGARRGQWGRPLGRLMISRDGRPVVGWTRVR